MDFLDQVELIKEYIEDSVEFLDGLDAMFLQLEQMMGHAPDPELITDVLSALHTFKGNSGMIGFPGIQKYTHRMEDLFKPLQSGNIELDIEFVDLIMRCANLLRKTISGISPDNPQSPDLDGDIEIVRRFIAEKSKLAPQTQGVSKDAKQSEAVNPFAKKTSVLKVDFQRLDNLLNLMGELVMHRTRLGRVDMMVREILGEKGVSLELSDTSEQIGKITTELHEAVMKVRMLPIKQVFMRFPRFVRDLAHERGKDINVQFDGEETELDKTIIDEIGEPLSHLIRNAIDHGVETPEERERLGKPRQGSILLRAYQESSHIVLTVEDDGRGIDRDKILRKAEQLGFSQKDEMIQPEISDLIFLPGLSTAEKVTEVSGRGLGMDVVRKSLAKINGIIEVDSEPNVGTRFTIKLPLTLAIISALMVRVADEQYAIPLMSVIESIKVKSAEIHSVNNREVTNVREKILPLVRLSKLFGLPHTANGKEIYAVIVQSTAGQMGIIVDTLLGQQEIVIKALDDYFGAAAGVAGATILGDGKVVLIVDVPTLTEKVKHRGGKENTEVRYA